MGSQRAGHYLGEWTTTTLPLGVKTGTTSLRSILSVYIESLKNMSAVKNIYALQSRY